MGQWYWISEYIKLLLAYGFVLYVWPQVVFENHLKGRSLTYRYCFCVIVTVLLVNTLVLGLGLIHCLRPWVSSLIFIGVFFWRLFANHPPFRILAQDIQSLHHETMSFRRLALRAWDRFKAGFSAWFEPVSSRMKGYKFEYFLLLVALVFGTLYFSWGPLTEHTFGCGDQFVHHQWTYELKEGKAFYSGIYPEAMHCVIYLTCTLFRIRLYTGILYFAGIHIHVLLISIWLLMKEIFQWRYTPLIGLAMFLCVDQLCMIEIVGMARLSWTLPMEYALFTVFLSGLFLIRFLRRVLRGERVFLHPLKPKQWGVLHDEDLCLFAGAVSVSLTVHFYITIVTFFMCAVVALVYIFQVFRRGSFLPLAAAVMLSLFVAVAPMAAAFAMGYPLQGSLYWAMGVMGADESSSDSNDQQESTENTEDTEEIEGTLEEKQDTSDAEMDDADLQDSDESGYQTTSSDMTVVQPEPQKTFSELIREKAKTVYWSAYYGLYPGKRALSVLAATAFALAISIGAHLFLAIRDMIVRRRVPVNGERPTVMRDKFDGVLIMALLSVVLMIMYCAHSLGLPQLVAGPRLCSPEHILLMMIAVVPLDCLMALLAIIMKQGMMKVLALSAFIGVYIAAQTGGFFHSYLYCELTRYNAAVELTNHIMETLPRHMYTVISTTEELYQVIDNGYHEELLSFIQQDSDDTYTIPTPYLLLYIEKRPIIYAQYHFADGPEWLARKDYFDLFGGNSSQCPEILNSEIDSKSAFEDIYYGSKLSDSATNPEGRRILESRAYRWYQTFSDMHPRDCSVIYEDDDFMCCFITQNPGSLYTLGIMGDSAE